MTPSLPQPLPFERGTVLGGRYELAELLGTGGHGAVYRAVQRPLGREVAVKVLLAETLAGEGALERLAREAGLVKRLEHPHTVRLYDFGTNESGQPFLVFELLRGRSLEDELRKGPLAIPRVAHVATQALKALMEAHGLGIVHRDIKPSNVLLLDYPGEPDFVKVLDFGVARSIETAEKAQITVAGQIIGTPAYMAPEQVDALPISPRADLYALGLVMAELIAGKPVFHHGSPVQIWMQQASPDPVPLSGVVLSSALGAVITRATKKRPEERYASAAEMLADIERAMAASVAGTDPLAKPLALSSVAFRSTARIDAPQTMPARPGSTPDLGAGANTRPPPAFTPIPQHRATSATSPPFVPSSVPSSAPSSSGRIVLVVGLVLGMLFVVLVAGGVGAYYAFRVSATAPPPHPDPTAPAPSLSTTLQIPTSGRLKKVDATRTEARLRAQGWALTSMVSEPGSGFRLVNFTGTRAALGLNVSLYEFESPQIAEQTASVLRSNAGIVERDGGRILFVNCFQDAAVTRAAFDDIVR